MAGQAPLGWAKKILHAGLAFGDGVLEGCDAMPGEYKKPKSFCAMLKPKDAKEQSASLAPLLKTHCADTDCRDFLGAAVREGRRSIRDADQLRETRSMKNTEAGLHAPKRLPSCIESAHLVDETGLDE
jgi:hypothetical protein